MSKGNLKKKLSLDDQLQMFGWILTDSVYDLSVPPEIFRDYFSHFSKVENFSKNGPDMMFEGVVRVCRFSTVMAICKLYDGLTKYSSLMGNAPEELRGRIKKFRKYVIEKDYRTLRSKFVAHNFDAYESYSYQSGQSIGENIFGSSVGDLLAYFEWIKPKPDQVSPDRYHPAYIASDTKEYIRTLTTLKPRVVIGGSPA